MSTTAKVMLVEDERVVAFNLQQRLSKLGYDVPGIAASGEEALRMAERTRPDLVLMDIHIQGDIDGIETASRLNASRFAPVIYLTAYSDESTLARARATRPYGYLLKPFSEREMHATIQMALERRKVEGALEESEERLSRALAASNVALWDFDIQSDTVYLSPQWSAMLGGESTPTTICSKELLGLTHPVERAKLYTCAIATLKGLVPFYEADHRVRTRNGEWIWIHSRGRVVQRDNAGRALRATGTNTDITARKRAEQRISYLATRDALTGLPNRTLFGDRLDQAIARAGRNSEHVALLFIDLDDFKTINDSLGHAIGDALLSAVAERLKRTVRKEDTVARQGGDEFIVLLPGADGSAGTLAAAEKIRRALAETYHIEGHALHVTSSIGIAVYPDDGTDAQTLQRGADAALYCAKASGRNQVQFFTQRLNENAQRRHLIGTSLRATLQGEQFETYYQARVDFASGAIVAAEALLRWRHPTMGMMLPSGFISVAEETGVISRIGDWIIEQACQGALALQSALGKPLIVSVNASALQLRERDFCQRLTDILGRSGLIPSCLELEITEGVLMDPRGDILTTLNSLGALGVRLALDDFGTGYSSLSYLHRFPVHVLKIDQSFVQGAQWAAGSAAIVRAIIALGHSLNLKVVAEGVETAEAVALLRALQCDEGQGHFFAKPMPLAELLSCAAELPLAKRVGAEQAPRNGDVASEA